MLLILLLSLSCSANNFLFSNSMELFYQHSVMSNRYLVDLLAILIVLLELFGLLL